MSDPGAKRTLTIHQENMGAHLFQLADTVVQEWQVTSDRMGVDAQPLDPQAAAEETARRAAFLYGEFPDGFMVGVIPILIDHVRARLSSS